MKVSGLEKSSLKEEHTLLSDDGKLIKLLKKIGKDDATIFFNYAEKLVNNLNIKEVDARVTYGTSENKRFSITIGQRYCLSLFLDAELPWHFILGKSKRSSEDVYVGKFDGNPKAYYYQCRFKR